MAVHQAVDQPAAAAAGPQLLPGEAGGEDVGERVGRQLVEVVGDFVAQGAANVASGFFRGLPVGGSLSTTALSVLAGARSRAAAILAGVWMGIIVVAFSGLIAHVAMPALAALLILASVSTIKVGDVRSIWSTGWASRIAVAVTFVSTLLLNVVALLIVKSYKERYE